MTKERAKIISPTFDTAAPSTVPEPVIARGVTVYKVLAGDTPNFLASYNQGCRPSAHDDLDGDNSLQRTDWRGLYTQFKRDHVLGTVPYRWERGQRQARLVAATFDELHIIVLDDPRLHQGDMNGTAKAAMIKQILNIPMEEPLITFLGRLGQVAMVRETETEWELVIPHDLLPELSFREKFVMSFQRHPQMPITWRYRYREDDSWLSWEEDLHMEVAIPDLDLPRTVPEASESELLDAQQELVLSIPEVLFSQQVQRIQIQANDAAGGHQEIRVFLEEGECGRISRTNGLDEVEFAKRAEDLGNLSLMLFNYEFDSSNPLTLRQVFDCFLTERKKLPSYEQGNCVVLCRRIVDKVAPGQYNPADNEEEDHFGF